MKGGNRPAAHRAEGRWIKPNVNSGKQYEIALTSILTAFLLRLSIDSFLVDHLAYVTSILAITLTTWYGSVEASLTAVILGALLTQLVFPLASLQIQLNGPG